MKKLIILFIIIFICFSSCKEASSLRYIIRSASKIPQIDKNKSKGNKSIIIKYDFKVLAVESKTDTLKRKFYKVQIVLPPDTSHYFSYTSIWLPSKIGIADVPKTIVRAQYFLHSDTVNVYTTRLIMYDKGIRKD